MKKIPKKPRSGGLKIGGGKSLFVIAGPCVIENEKSLINTAKLLKKITRQLNIPFVFKASYDKANRSSIRSYRGPGLKEGLKMLARLKKELKLIILSDVHSVQDVVFASEVLDIIQIPALLSRQTDLITAAARTGKTVNIKKGQYLAPWEIENVIKKITSTGNNNIIITERGTSFGYNNLVSDMRSIPIMKSFGYPVVYDASHSAQLPGGAGTKSGGQKEFVPVLAQAAVAAGCDGVFLEVHPNPNKALCDGPNMLSLKNLPGLLKTLKRIHQLVS